MRMIAGPWIMLSLAEAVIPEEETIYIERICDRFREQLERAANRRLYVRKGLKMGLSIKEIANQLGVSPTTIARAKNWKLSRRRPAAKEAA